MKIAIIGASGKQGGFLLKEAIARGHEVTAIVRDKTKVTEPKATVLEKALLDLTYADLQDHAVIIDAFGTWAPETLILHQTTLKYLADLLSGKPNRLLVVGGAGSLYVDPEHTLRLMDTPDFPAEYKAIPMNMAAAFDALRVRKDVNWTYLSPAADFVADGPRTGKYRTGGDELIFNSAGKSQISYADYAVAMIDEAEQGKHIQSRFTVVSESI